MPWIEQPSPPCTHPNRPTPTLADKDRIWECEICLDRWIVFVVDLGHDVNPGEVGYQVRWRAAVSGAH